MLWCQIRVGKSSELLIPANSSEEITSRIIVRLIHQLILLTKLKHIRHRRGRHPTIPLLPILLDTLSTGLEWYFTSLMQHPSGGWWVDIDSSWGLAYDFWSVSHWGDWDWLEERGDLVDHRALLGLRDFVVVGSLEEYVTVFWGLGLHQWLVLLLFRTDRDFWDWVWSFLEEAWWARNFNVLRWRSWYFKHIYIVRRRPDDLERFPGQIQPILPGKLKL